MPDPVEMDRVALADKEVDRLVKRQAHRVGKGADQLCHKRTGQALDSVAAGLASPFARGEIALPVLPGQPLEPDPRLDDPLADRSLRRDQANAGMHPVRSS